jgi:hypothetical protein
MASITPHLTLLRTGIFNVIGLVLFIPALSQGSVADPISGQDVDGHAVAVNGKGHFTVVMYTNPDLEDESCAYKSARNK